MAPPTETALSKAEWERIQSSLNRPEPKVYSRPEVIEMNRQHFCSKTEDKLLTAKLRRMHAERQVRNQEKEEYLNMLAAEEVEMKKQDWQQAVDIANGKRFVRNGCVRKFNRALQATHVQKENEAVVKFNQERERIAKERIRQHEEEMRARQREALRREQEKAYQRQLYNQSVADFRIEQTEEKKQSRARERQQEKEERDRFRYLDELHEQELRNQAEEKAEGKKSYMKYRLEDISSKNLHREREEQKLNTEKRERKRAVSDIEQKQQKQKDDQAEKFRKRQVVIEHAADKLAVSKKEQAATLAQREEAKFSREVAEQDAEAAKRQREREENRDAAFKAFSAHRNAMTEEKIQNEEAELKSTLDWYRDQREAHRLFLDEQKLKDQRAKESRVKCRDSNVGLMAEKRAHAEQLKREERDVAVKDAEAAAARKKKLQQYVQSELHKAAEDQRSVSHILAARTGGHGILVDGEEPDYFCKTTDEPMPRFATDQTRFMKQFLERKSLQLSMVDMKPSRLLPLTSAVKQNFTAKGLVGGRVEGSSYCAKATEGLLPRLGASETWLN